MLPWFEQEIYSRQLIVDALISCRQIAVPYGKVQHHNTNGGLVGGTSIPLPATVLASRRCPPDKVRPLPPTPGAATCQTGKRSRCDNVSLSLFGVSYLRVYIFSDHRKRAHKIASVWPRQQSSGRVQRVSVREMRRRTCPTTNIGWFFYECFLEFWNYCHSILSQYLVIIIVNLVY